MPKDRKATSKKATDRYLKEPYARILIPEKEGGYSAEILEFPGCYSQGETPEDALKNLENAAKSWIKATIEQGQEVPPPSAAYDYSGKIALRVPRNIHQLAVRFAERNDTSLNQFLLSAVASRVGAEELFGRMIERLESFMSGFGNRLTHTMTTAITVNAIDIGALSVSLLPTFVLTPQQTAIALNREDHEENDARS